MKRADLNRRQALAEIRIANFRKMNVSNEIKKMTRMKTQLQLVIASIDAALENMARMGMTPLETAQINSVLASTEKDTASCPQSQSMLNSELILP